MTSSPAHIAQVEPPASVTEALHQSLASARKELLDLSSRNRLIHTPRDSARSTRLDVVGERADDVFRILVREARAMTFGARDSGGGEVADPEDPEERYTDNKLETRLDSEALSKRLLRLYYDANTFLEEQGVNVLYLALGFLRWYEAPNSDKPRHAPLILIPIELERLPGGKRFTARYTGAELFTNLSLAAKLEQEFRLTLPELPDAEELQPASYFAQVSSAIGSQARWDIDADGMVLWFYSFAKFLMFRDLEPGSWPQHRKLEQASLVQALLRDGFASTPPIISDEAKLDDVIEPHDLVHVLDADSSQATAIEEVRRGRSLVIHGPPGTGKSQTITNLIATAVRDGKRVLFVAEKMAALEVVKRRLDEVELGMTCLELHSHKANKLSVLEELRRTLDLGKPIGPDPRSLADELRTVRDRLNGYVSALHSPVLSAGYTPFKAMARLARVYQGGVRLLECAFPDAVQWTYADLEQRVRALEELQAPLEKVGNPQLHPGRGVRALGLLPSDRQRIAAILQSTVCSLAALREHGERLAAVTRLPPPVCLADFPRLLTWAAHLGCAPRADLSGLATSTWDTASARIAELVSSGEWLAAERAQLSEQFADIAWSTDATSARRDLAAYGRSLFRFFNGKYRQAQATLRGILRAAPPDPLETRIALLDALLKAQRARASILANDGPGGLGQQAFGPLWQGEASSFGTLQAIVRWAEAGRELDASGTLRKAATSLDGQPHLSEFVANVQHSVAAVTAELGEVFARLEYDVNEAFGVDAFERVPVSELLRRLEAWATGPVLEEWRSYYTLHTRLARLGLDPLARFIDQGMVSAANLVDQFEGSYCEAVARAAYTLHPGLISLDRNVHDQAIQRFKSLDRERLRAARLEVSAAHHRGLPTGQGEAGEMGVLRREMNKKRRHLPIRKLLTDAGRTIQAIKPVFMMSPLSISQFLTPGGIHFDLVLIDEASQVRPVDALGAMARADQVVVVGDDRQLPPTSFFQQLTTDDVTEPREDEVLKDVESVLGLCLSRNVPDRTLRWHYRSKHASLIAVSNSAFYDSKLFIPPSPERSGHSNSGLKLRIVADGVFDRGGSATNRPEAAAVAQAVLAHARTNPNKSLGVGTFSVAQRDVVLDQVEVLRRAHPELEQFCSSGGTERFFVKNLENIQGDERDVIFISIGYGKDASGYMAMSFGPLNNDGGERRLNVLITRARELCEVFSSIRAGDIVLKSDRLGVKVLKQFLHYAETGYQDIGIVTARGFDSEFEADVAAALRRQGHEVDSQVGVAGFFIDLAVVNPRAPGRYSLGIECDGAAYHSARWARDRDRLRQQVLEDRGWRIHRVWSTDWLNNPQGEMEKLSAAIEAARTAPSSPPRSFKAAPAPQAGIARAKAESSPVQQTTKPYQQADFTVNTQTAIHDMPVSELADVVIRVLQVEGPIHEDEVARRITERWGLSRTGGRIAGAVADALHQLIRSGRANADGKFHSIPGAAIIARDRSNARSANLRKAEYVAPSELGAAIAAAVAANQGIASADAVAEAARLLGFKSTGAQIRTALEQQLQVLAHDRIEVRDGRCYSSV